MKTAKRKNGRSATVSRLKEARASNGNGAVAHDEATADACPFLRLTRSTLAENFRAPNPADITC